MGEISNRRTVTGYREISNPVGLSGVGNFLYCAAFRVIARYDYNAQTGVLSSRTVLRSVGNYQGIAGDSIDFRGSGVQIGNTYTELRIGADGVHRVGNRVLVASGNTLYIYNIGTTSITSRVTIGTFSEFEIIRGITVFGNKLLLTGVKNRRVLLYDMDYDLTTNTVSNIEQVTGTFLYDFVFSMTTINNKLVAFGRGSQDGSLELYDFDYTAVDERIKTLTDSTTPTDSLGTMVVHRKPVNITESTTITDSISTDVNPKIVRLSDGESLFIKDNSGQQITTRWSIHGNSSIEANARIVVRNNNANPIDRLMASREYMNINPADVRFRFQIRTISNSRPYYIRVIVDGVNYDTPDIAINQGNHVWELEDETMQGIPSGTRSSVRVELRSKRGPTNFRLYWWELHGRDLINDSVKASVKVIPKTRISEAVDISDDISLQKLTRIEIESDSDVLDSMQIKKAVTKKITNSITTTDSIDIIPARTAHIFDALYGNPKDVFDNFNDGTSDRHGWVGGGVSPSVATVRPEFYKIYQDWNPNDSTLVIRGISVGSEGVQDYRVKILAQGKSVIFGPYQNNISPRIINIPRDFPNVRGDVRVEFYADNNVRAFSFFIRSVRFYEKSQISDALDIISLVNISDSITPSDSVRFVNSPQVTISEDLEVLDAIESITGKEIFDAIMAIDDLAISRLAITKLSDSEDATDSTKSYKIETAKLLSDIDISDKVAKKKQAKIEIAEHTDIDDTIDDIQYASAEISDDIDAADTMKISKKAISKIKSITTAIDRLTITTEPIKRIRDTISADSILSIKKLAKHEFSSIIQAVDGIREYRRNARNLSSSETVNDILESSVSAGRKILDAIMATSSMKITKDAKIKIESVTSAISSVIIKKAGQKEVESDIDADDTLHTTTHPRKSQLDSIDTIDSISLKKLSKVKLTSTTTASDVLAIIRLAVKNTMDSISVDDILKTQAGLRVKISDSIGARSFLASGTGRFIDIVDDINVNDSLKVVKERIVKLYSKTKFVRDRLSGPSTGIRFEVNTARRKIFRF